MNRALLHLLRACDSKLPAAARREAFGHVVAAHQDAAFATAYAVSGDLHAAQDATLEAFLAAWRNLDSLREPAAFGGWLRTLVRTRALRHLQRHQPPVASLDLAADIADPGASNNRWIDLDYSLCRLPESEREAIVLFYIAGLTREETASFMGTSVVSTKKRLARALAILRKETFTLANEDIGNTLPSQSDAFRKQTLLLTGQFAELLSSGRPILQALDDCIAQAGDGTVGNAFKEMRVQVTQGKLMADAMLRYPSLFDRRDAQAVQFAEEMGLLDRVLRRLADGEKFESIEGLRLEYGSRQY